MSTSDYKGISGWLVLVAFGLVVSPFRFYFTTLSMYPGLFENGTWYLLTSPNSAEYVRGFGTLLYSEIVFNLFLFVSLIYLNFLFFSKKSDFPKVYIAISLIGLLFIPINAYFANLLFPQTPLFDGGTIRNFFVSLLSALIWIPYMIKSKRVKNTFIENHSLRKTVLSMITLSCVVAVGYSFYLKQVSYIPETVTIEDRLNQLTNDMNRELPIMLDSETKLDAVYTESNNLQYRYSLVNYSVSDIDANALNKNMRPSLLQTACSNSATLTFMQEGVIVSYTYYDKLGKLITSIQINSSDCV
ncbi:TPA: DUF2569 domain-containing protein [Vibrio alginolyticus]|uniref:DUF2569 domain-containing protein n=1 Tax=Vibrio alginolyticus TaxID=663 RepID=UPI001A19AA1C|nr:DUF2569 domain-containing protein [Vibrio alginolyticus]EGQ7649823.1 DUF2569 domain-containing protein [Vibrio alginolyticus]MBS9989724.1 DUF2569 domain-containing protein [Vibrio alginolyticus]MBT0077626.1 DUF2569 domain-containing protein [Vibrio alginolyticus]